MGAHVMLHGATRSSTKPSFYVVSLSMVVLNSRDRPGKLWLPDFPTSNKTLK